MSPESAETFTTHCVVKAASQKDQVCLAFGLPDARVLRCDAFNGVSIRFPHLMVPSKLFDEMVYVPFDVLFFPEDDSDTPVEDKFPAFELLGLEIHVEQAVQKRKKGMCTTVCTLATFTGLTKDRAEADEFLDWFEKLILLIPE